MACLFWVVTVEDGPFQHASLAVMLVPVSACFQTGLRPVAFVICKACQKDIPGDAALCPSCGSTQPPHDAAPRPYNAFDPVRPLRSGLSTMRDLFRLSTTIFPPKEPK
jgi:hypothetical protein